MSASLKGPLTVFCIIAGFIANLFLAWAEARSMKLAKTNTFFFCNSSERVQIPFLRLARRWQSALGILLDLKGQRSSGRRRLIQTVGITASWRDSVPEKKSAILLKKTKKQTKAS